MNDLLADTLGGCSLWFTCSLVLVELFIFVMLLSRSNKACVYLLVSILIAFLGLFLVNNDVSILGMSDFPWFYKRAMIALLYVVCGGFYYKYETILCHFVSKWYSMIFLVLFYITIEFCMPEKALCLTSVGQMNVLGVMVSIVGTVLLIEFCRRLKKYKILTFIGRNSIVFYFFSGALPVTLCAVLSKVMAIQNIVGAFIVFAISLFMGGVVAYIVSRWLPWLIDVRKVSNRFSLCQIK